MKFNTSIAKELTKSDDIKYFTSGIMEDVVLKSVELKETPTGTKYISFIFGKEGYKDWEYSQYVPSRFQDETSDEGMITRMNNQIARFDKILRAFYPEESQRQFEADDFMEYLHWVKEMFLNADKSTLLRIKTIYDDKGYLTFPRYLKFDFVERMDTDKRKVEILRFDQLARPIVADKEVPEQNTAETSVESSISEPANDMPF